VVEAFHLAVVERARRLDPRDLAKLILEHLIASDPVGA